MFIFLILVDNGSLKGSERKLKLIGIVFLVLLVLLVLVFLTNLKIIIDYYHGNDNDQLNVKFKALFGLIQYKLNVPVIKVSKDSPEVVVETKTEAGAGENTTNEDTKKYTPEDLMDSIKDFKTLIEHIAGFYKVIRAFLRKVSIEKFQWHTLVGVGDAAYTGMVAGALWTAKGGLLGLLGSLMKLEEIPEVTVTPSFQMAVTQTSLKCMIRFRIGNAILAGIKLFKLWKGGKAHFRTKPFSVFSKEKTKTI